MKHTTDTFTVSGQPVTAAYFSTTPPEAAVYMLSGEFFDAMLPEIMAQLYDRVDGGLCTPFVLVLCSRRDWNGSFSPWPVPPLRSGSPPFSGGAEETVRWCSQIKRSVCDKYGISPDAQHNFLLGYSLSGLCALYAAYISRDFGGAGCCSPSLWYDGWIEFMEKSKPLTDVSVYLSLGRKEEKVRSVRMGSIGRDVRAAAQILTSQGFRATFCRNNGGHDYQVPQRLSNAIAWLLVSDENVRTAIEDKIL